MQISTDQGLLGLIISRDVKFDKSAIVDGSNKSIKTVKDHDVIKLMELEVEVLCIVALG